MAEERLLGYVGPGLSAFRQKRLKTGSSEISNAYRATQSVSSGAESDSCIGKTGNNEMQEDSDDEVLYIEETDDDENKECCDDDDAGRSILYCIILSGFPWRIDLNSNDWYQRLRKIRHTYNIKHRSRDEDILAIQSMIKTSRLVKMDQNIVQCDVNSIGHAEDDRVYNCLTFNKEYEKFLKVTPTSVLRTCVPHMTDIQEKIMSSCEISDIILNFGLDFVKFSHTRREYDTKYQKGLKILNLPYAVVNMVELSGEFRDFKEYVEEIMKREQKSLESLNLNSLLGSYLIGKDTGKEKALDNLAVSHTKWSILVSILMSESYSFSLSSSWEKILTKLQSAFPLLRCDSRMLDSFIAELTDISKVLNKENNSVGFISYDVRHQVMSYFVKNCLITDEDYENYIKLSSVDSLLEYVRPWWQLEEVEYTRLKKYLFLPECLMDSFIQRLGLDVLRHVIIDWRVRDRSNDRIKAVRETVQEK